MKWKEYHYSGQWGKDGVVAYRPLIQVEVSRNGSDTLIPIIGLIDSGTDGILFDIEVAKILGIDTNSCQRVRVGGVGEKEGFRCQINLSIPDFKVSIDASAIFTEDLPFSCLLGQREFFEKFHIRFEKNRNRFYLAIPKKKER